MYKYKTALFIGRFQPFHNGHLYSLKKCLEFAEKVVVGIGSAQESETAENPWDCGVRRQMIDAVAAGKNLQERMRKIVEIPDYPSDEEWVRVVKVRAREFDVVVSNNEWTLRVLANAGYETKQSGLYNRDELEGVKIRELMRQGNEGWKNRVPREIVRLFDNNDIEMIR